MSTERTQAKALVRWLEQTPGTEPPAELQAEVVESIYALRPDLAPAPRVTIDDILQGVTEGPFAAVDPASVAGLVEWLEGHPGDEPPAATDALVVEAVFALRPDLAPAPRVSIDDILGGITVGPFAELSGTEPATEELEDAPTEEAPKPTEPQAPPVQSEDPTEDVPPVVQLAATALPAPLDFDRSETEETDYGQHDLDTEQDRGQQKQPSTEVEIPARVVSLAAAREDRARVQETRSAAPPRTRRPLLFAGGAGVGVLLAAAMVLVLIKVPELSTFQEGPGAADQPVAEALDEGKAAPEPDATESISRELEAGEPAPAPPPSAIPEAGTADSPVEPKSAPKDDIGDILGGEPAGSDYAVDKVSAGAGSTSGSVGYGGLASSTRSADASRHDSSEGAAMGGAGYAAPAEEAEDYQLARTESKSRASSARQQEADLDVATSEASASRGDARRTRDVRPAKKAEAAPAAAAPVASMADEEALSFDDDAGAIAEVARAPASPAQSLSNLRAAAMPISTGPNVAARYPEVAATYDSLKGASYDSAAATLMGLLSHPDPDVVMDAAYRLASLHVQHQRTDMATSAIARGLSASGGSSINRARLLALKGEVLQRRGDSNGAAEAYKQAIRAQGREAETYAP